MYHLEVVTPEGYVFKGDVEQAVINTSDGEIGILENHMLLLTNVIPGKLRVEKSPEDIEEFATTYGIIDIRGDKVIVLVEEASPIDKIDVEKEKSLLKKAEEQLANSEKLSLKEIEYYEKLRDRALTLLELAGVKHI
ncbi:MAG: ATP synthase F1 subunit epsilon [Persephonella sp.]|nr:MAG: ATP synthase F1 subunit epsilon [Persephonella sp.]RUM58747.1 MAG: ATP synthase F1 subunit epsilon [Persephonella sp.]